MTNPALGALILGALLLVLSLGALVAGALMFDAISTDVCTALAPPEFEADRAELGCP